MGSCVTHPRPHRLKQQPYHLPKILRRGWPPCRFLVQVWLGLPGVALFRRPAGSGSSKDAEQARLSVLLAASPAGLLDILVLLRSRSCRHVSAQVLGISLELAQGHSPSTLRLSELKTPPPTLGEGLLQGMTGVQWGSRVIVPCTRMCPHTTFAFWSHALWAHLPC